MDLQDLAMNLPENFAETLLDLEMDLEKNCRLETIRLLVALYSRAIEYYESIKDSKYKAYHKRMKSLLVKEQVQQVLTATSKPFNRKPLSSLNINKLKTVEVSAEGPDTAPTNDFDQNLPPQAFKDTPTKYSNLRTAELQIQDYCSETQNSKKHALCNIKNQEETIEDKLKARRISRSNTLGARVDGDKSAGRDRYQDGVVEIMERFLNQKVESTSEIKKKYQGQMEEIRMMGSGGIILEVLRQMESAMNKEIEEACVGLELRKGEEIAKMREVLFL